ncbi:MAG: serine/threonine protein kinase [Myxococcales bacterium]|nr:serine/threonine protein kinase [Myxococcales bacterium]
MPFAQQLGRYQLLDRIAFGGMAEIFRAKTFDDEGRAHLVAVKRVLNHLTSDDDFVRMLVDEAKITAVLQHENIARVYEFAVDHGAGGDEYFLAMEYVDGKDVRTLLDRHRAQQKPILPEHVAWIGMEVAHALYAAHTQRDGANRPLHIVHRDVSPSNVLLSYRGEVKLCDFGIAKATTTRVQTKTGVIKGKVKYMSPEQAMGRKLDHRSDLFSLGTVMYEMLTLTAPFIAATEVELIFAVRDARKREAREVHPGVPEELNAILNKLMSRSRSQRFQSGAELAAALQTFLEHEKAGYRRSHFGRYMRATFEADIERELRLMEEYIIEGADASKVGENLIADALGNDAPYTKFTAAIGGSRADTGNFPRIEQRPPTDLHAEHTRILTRNQSSPTTRPLQGSASPELAPLAEQSTRILDRSPPGIHELPTGPKHLPDLHEQNTQIRLAPERPPAPPQSPANDELPELHGLETKIIVRDIDTRAPTTVGDLANAFDDAPLVQFEDDQTGATTERSPDRPRRDTEPVPQLHLPREPNAPNQFADGEETTTSVPLSDEDLEEGTES